ncbi:MAG: CidA/LrgA family protein [Tagaea sp.]|nr:CidA/LrgA family protein [Azospirillum sp.]MCA3266655.1 CidA/LrgA family protein [Azospirillum sp.]MCZ8124860.1 CidA/LrgA family protein [Magnetospirillum sp.]
MIENLTLLLVCQLIGEAVVRLAGLPVPGPVVGMALLFGLLAWRGGIPDGLGKTTAGLLDHLSLLFVPAGVGVILHFDLVAAEWPAIVGALILSTLATIAVTALVMRKLAKPEDRA